MELEGAVTDIAQASKRQQLQMLREQTRLTGALHEAQVLQLKLWPMVVFQDAISSSFTWSPEKKVVLFAVEFPDKAPTPKLAWWKKRVEALNGWVQELLGPEWCIRVGCREEVYSGARKIVNDNGNRRDAGTKRSSAH